MTSVSRNKYCLPTTGEIKGFKERVPVAPTWNYQLQTITQNLGEMANFLFFAILGVKKPPKGFCNT